LIRKLWNRESLDPAVKGQQGKGRVIRGAVRADDKGQTDTFVEALRAWKAVNGDFPCR